MWHAIQHIDAWSENLRKFVNASRIYLTNGRWLAKNLFQELVKRIDLVDEQMKRGGCGHLSCEVVESVNNSTAPSATKNIYQQKQPHNITSLSELYSLYGSVIIYLYIS